MEILSFDTYLEALRVATRHAKDAGEWWAIWLHFDARWCAAPLDDVAGRDWIGQSIVTVAP